MSDDPNSEGLFAIFEVHFGDVIHQWPKPSLPPRVVWSDDDDQINTVLWYAQLPAIDDGFRRRWWEEYRFGQIHEDVGGFLWRCWCRAMQVPNVFLARYGRQVEQ